MRKHQTTSRLLGAVALVAFAMSAQAAGNGNASNTSSGHAASANDTKGNVRGNSNSADSANKSTSNTSSYGNAGSASNNNGSGSGSSSSGSNSNSGSGGSSNTSDVPTPGGTVAWIGSTSDVTYTYDAMAHAVAANDFYGLVSGNDSQGINDLGLPWGSGWTLVAKDNTDGGGDVASGLLGIAFSLNAGARAAAGSWTLTGTGLGPTSVLLDIVTVLKSSTNYGLYYFHDITFDGSGGGTWLSPVFNVNGMRQDLSHMSVYARAVSDSGPSSPQGGWSNTAGSDATTSQGNAVPEPGSLALVAVALAGLAAIGRKAARRSA